ncbi:hypothetical protein B0J14DRAFT_658586 [Halenospora varia]|nr:hypothetical protein B0J14DRAFT_658586 [Halenospora varia]
MMFHLMIDFAIGLVPFIGDIADMAFRANTKNAVLLEEYLRVTTYPDDEERGSPPLYTTPTI